MIAAQDHLMFRQANFFGRPAQIPRKGKGGLPRIAAVGIHLLGRGLDAQALAGCLRMADCRLQNKGVCGADGRQPDGAALLVRVDDGKKRVRHFFKL